MNRIVSVCLSVLILVILFGASLTAHANEPTSELPVVKSKAFDEARATAPLPKPGSRVYVSITDVTFSQTWERKFRTGIDPAYRDRTRDTYTRLLQQAISDALVADGYEIGEHADAADLIVNAGLSKLFTNSPELDVISESYARYAGSVTFEWDMSDSSHTPLMSLRDHRQTRYREGIVDRSWRGLVDRDFEHLFIRWSKDAVALLNTLQE